MTTIIGEPIKVIAVFDGGIRPVRFKWNGRVYAVKEITYQWRSREGSAVRIHFSVFDGASLYELSYNQGTMKWSIEGVEA
ncbi:MAG: hypothetical protein ACE5EB_08610 [Thermodesulfobacteriota bacterium]